jgi:hypothetical protein
LSCRGSISIRSSATTITRVGVRTFVVAVASHYISRRKSCILFGREYVAIHKQGCIMDFTSQFRRISLPLITSILASQSAVASDSGTLTPGEKMVCLTTPPANISITTIGYESETFGTYSPTGLTGGETVMTIEDYGSWAGTCPAPTTKASLSVSGFGSNPGSSWLSSITCNGVQKLSSAATFNYSGGTASWSWTSVFGLANNKQVSCTIVHS